MLPFLLPAECSGGWPSICVPTFLAAIDEGKEQVEFLKQVLVKEIHVKKDLLSFANN